MADWTNWIDPAFLGPIIHPGLGPGINNIQQQISLNLDDRVRATVRHGAYPDAARNNMPTYLVDTDIFRESLLPFDTDGIFEMTERLHDWNLRLFQAIVTPAMLVHLRNPEAVAP
jgi:uncharacterized protein (TIGR04255 family)